MEVSSGQLHSWQSDNHRTRGQQAEIYCTARVEAKIKYMRVLIGENHQVHHS